MGKGRGDSAQSVETLIVMSKFLGCNVHPKYGDSGYSYCIICLKVKSGFSVFSPEEKKIDMLII